MNKKLIGLSLSSLCFSLIACGGNKPTITIKNKQTKFTLIDEPYTLEIEKGNIKSGEDNVVFAIDNTNVANVSNEGIITFVGDGSATITASYSKYSNVSDSFTFQVIPAYNIAINGTLTSFTGEPASDVVVACNNATTRTNSEGKYELNAIVGTKFNVKTFNHLYADTVKTFTYDDKIVYTYDLTLSPYQSVLKCFVDNSDIENYITVSPHHKKINEHEGILFSFKANFENAFAEKNNYKLLINSGTSLPNGVKTKGDYEISFNYQGIDYDKSTKYDPNPVKVVIDNNSNVTSTDDTLDLFLTVGDMNSTLNFSKNDTFGFYVESEIENPRKEGKCLMFNHKMSKENQYSYVRVDSYSRVFAATNNEPKFNGLSFDMSSDTEDWQFLKSDNEQANQFVGQVNNKFDNAYSFKVARYIKPNDPTAKKDIYFLYKKTNPEQNPYFFEEVYEPSLFIDTYQGKAKSGHEYPTKSTVDPKQDPERKVDNRVISFKLRTGYWLTRFNSKDDKSAFPDDTATELDKDFEKGFDIYSKGDEMILKIPYSMLTTPSTKTFDSDKSFGFAVNLYYRGWKPYYGSNPTGYTDIPHFEEITSYIRVNQSSNNFNIIPYDNIK